MIFFFCSQGALQVLQVLPFPLLLSSCFTVNALLRTPPLCPQQLAVGICLHISPIIIFKVRLRVWFDLWISSQTCSETKEPFFFFKGWNCRLTQSRLVNNRSRMFILLFFLFYSPRGEHKALWGANMNFYASMFLSAPFLSLSFGSFFCVWQNTSTALQNFN